MNGPSSYPTSDGLRMFTAHEQTHFQNSVRAWPFSRQCWTATWSSSWMKNSPSICVRFITPRNSSQKRSELVSNPHVHARIIQSATEALFIPCASSSCRFYHQIESTNTINSTQQLACTNKQEKKNISCVLLLFGAVQKKKRVNRGEQG